MRYMLAILFEPTHPHETRQLVIRNRKAGDYAVDLEMARFVADKVDNENEKVIAAIKLAAECFGVSFSTAKRAWTKYGRWLK